MIQVGIRETQKHLTKLLKDLPFVITRFGKPIAQVVEPQEELETSSIVIELCKHGRPKDLCTDFECRGT